MKYNDDGEELPDPTPVQLTVKQRMSVNKFLHDKAQILAAIERSKEFEGEETFEESMDFEVEDDDVPMTPFERAELERDDFERTARFVKQKEELDAVSRRAGRGQDKQLSGDASPGAVRPGTGHADVQGGNAGGGASAVRSVESGKDAGSGGPGGKGAG